MLKRLLLTATALASLAVASLVGATPANADSTLSIWNDTHQILRGTAHFASYGEIFTACDKYPDGYGISLDWYVVSNPSNHGSAYDKSGANDGDCAVSNANITEGREVAYRICLRDDGAYKFCSDYFRDTA
jgi:hypothetical protein